MAADLETSGAWAWTMMEPELTERERELRDRFVDEYLKDENPTLAASRVGFQNAFAKEYGQKFILEAYVQKRIAKLQEKPAENPKEEERRLRLKVMRRLESEASNLANPPASRVAALGKLSAILGMDAPIKTQQTVTHQGGVMQVPAIADIGQWEAAATNSQTKLAQDARN